MDLTNLKNLVKRSIPNFLLEEYRELNRKKRSIRYYSEIEKNNPGNFYSLNAFDYYKCIFVHIPKAAGISVSTGLFGNYGGGHRTIREYQKIYPAKTFNRYFKFTFVRNPYERVLSAYNFLKTGGMNDEDKAWADKYLIQNESFDDFILNRLDETLMYSWYHFMPQVHFLMNDEGAINIDYIGRFENLEQDYTFIKTKIGLKSNNLAHRNKTLIKEPKKEMPLSVKSKICELYNLDFSLLDYNY